MRLPDEDWVARFVMLALGVWLCLLAGLLVTVTILAACGVIDWA